MAVINKIQFKRGVKATLEAKLVGVNKPAAGEPIFETDTNKLKIGDKFIIHVLDERLVYEIDQIKNYKVDYKNLSK